jgi:galactokinase
VTGAALAERVHLEGLDATDVGAKTALFDLALARFAAAHGGEPAHVWWVPGRLEVFGKHTDYAGGRSIVAPMPRGFVFVAAARHDDDLHVIDARTNEDVRIGQGGERLTGWRHYVEVLVRRFRTNFPGTHPGASVVFASDVPRAAGMSSSSAMVVGIASVLVRLWRLDRRDEWTASIGHLADRAIYFACVENGLSFGALAGDAGVGTHGGSEDHAAMLLGRPGHVSAFSFVPLRALVEVPVPQDWTFVIATSGVRAAKTGDAQRAYNHLSEGVTVLLRLWNETEPRVDSLAAALKTSPSAADRLRDRVRQTQVPGWSHAALENRLEHFIREDARAPAAVRAFEQQDQAVLAALAEQSQRDAEHLLGNQVPETIALAQHARDAGAFAACSFGAGFGGAVWALTSRAGASEFAVRWLADYRRARPDREGATSFVAIPGPPLVEVTE